MVPGPQKSLIPTATNYPLEMASIKSKSTSKQLNASPTRVFVDVTPPRHQGPRLSLADVDIDASKSSKLASLSSKLSSKGSTSLNVDSAKRAGKDGRALKPTTRTNSSTSVKRGREDDSAEKEGLKKRKVEQVGLTGWLCRNFRS